MRHSERGASTVEFGLLVAAMAVVIIGAVSAVGDGLGSLLNSAVTLIGG